MNIPFSTIPHHDNCICVKVFYKTGDFWCSEQGDSSRKKDTGIPPGSACDKQQQRVICEERICFGVGYLCCSARSALIKIQTKRWEHPSLSSTFSQLLSQFETNWGISGWVTHVPSHLPKRSFSVYVAAFAPLVGTPPKYYSANQTNLSPHPLHCFPSLRAKLQYQHWDM